MLSSEEGLKLNRFLLLTLGPEEGVRAHVDWQGSHNSSRAGEEVCTALLLECAPGLATWTSPEMQSLGPHPRSTETEAAI